jgi:glycosyltransferase involved in cell wall biosynthesis
MRALTVLYIHATAAFGGASKSLCELLQAMPPGTVNAVVLCPQGAAAEQFRRAGARVVTAHGVSRWDHTRYGFYRRMRWLVLLRELMYALPTWLALRRVRRDLERVDVVHANDAPVLIAGALASRMFKAPLVVHARSVQNNDENLLRTRWQNALLRRTNAHVIAIDETVRRSISGSMEISVVHNGLRMAGQTESQSAWSSRKGLFRVAMVGVLLRLKGVFEFVEAARLCRDRGIEAEFWIVGENVRELKGVRGGLLSRLGFAEDVRAGLNATIRAHQLEDRVKLLGFREDVCSIYRQIDVLCFPSYLDAAGRPVFEAAWFNVPSIVAVQDPLPDTIIHGQSGLCVPQADAGALADAIAFLHQHRAERARLGRGARRLAETYFDQTRNSSQVLEIYRTLCGWSAGRSAAADRESPVLGQSAGVTRQAHD